MKGLAQKGFLTNGFVPSIDGRELPRGPSTPDAPEMAVGIPLNIGTNKDEATLFLASDQTIVDETDAAFENRVRKTYPAQADHLIPALWAAYAGYSPGYLSIALAAAQMFWVDSIVLAERKVRQRTRLDVLDGLGQLALCGRAA